MNGIAKKYQLFTAHDSHSFIILGDLFSLNIRQSPWKLFFASFLKKRITVLLLPKIRTTVVLHLLHYCQFYHLGLSTMEEGNLFFEVWIVNSNYVPWIVRIFSRFHQPNVWRRQEFVWLWLNFLVYVFTFVFLVSHINWCTNMVC